MVTVCWPRWPPRPYMVKTFKNLLLQNQECLGAEPLQESSGTGGLPKLLKKLSYMTFDLFTAKSSLLPYAFEWEKPLKIFFSKTEHALWLNLCIYLREQESYQNCYNNGCTLTFDLFTVRSILLPYAFVWEKMFRISNNFSSGASGPILLKFHMEPP